MKNVIDNLIEIIEFVLEKADELDEHIPFEDAIKIKYDMLNALGECSSDAIGSLKLVKEVLSIPDKMFMKKFEVFCTDISAIPLEKRKRYLERIGKEKLNKESVFLLDAINKVEDFSKFSIYKKLFESRIDDKIDDMFHRYMFKVEMTTAGDLEYMRTDIKNDNFYLNNYYLESLMSNGWIIYSGEAWVTGEIAHVDNKLYKYSDSAKKFCEIVFGVTTDDSVKNSPIIISVDK